MFDLDVLFQKGELIPVIIQDEETREVLMLGFTNRKAVELTLQTGTAWFWSRSRQTLWEQGGELRTFPPRPPDADRLRYRYPALSLSAGGAHLSHRVQQAAFSMRYP